jgi:two-component system nitrogen regulation response regulator NtrX
MAFDVLVVDDESDITELVCGILNDEGYTTQSASSCVEAMDAIRKRVPHLVVLDVWLGDGDIDGLRLLEMIKTEHEFVPVIMMSGHGTIETAVNAIKKGAYDFIEKPFDSNRLLLAASKALESSALKMEISELKIKARVDETIIGESSSTDTLRSEVRRVAKLSSRVFIQGPVGSDKEGVAREIHRLSEYSALPFMFVNCQVMNQTRLEVDIFGAELRNPETGKLQIKTGIFEKAKGGTVYFSEVTLLSPTLQTRLLRAINESEYKRTGGTSPIPLRARIISSSSLNIDNGSKTVFFNNELYEKLSTNVIKIAPLFSRQEDIPLLIDYFMKQSAKAYNIPAKIFDSEAISILMAYYWPGDVMQLRNLIDWVLFLRDSEIASRKLREAAFADNKARDRNADDRDDDIIHKEDLPKEITEGKSLGGNSNTEFISFVSGLSIKEAREAFEREYFIEQLRKFEGNVSQTSRFVGMERSALHRKLKSLNIHEMKFSFSQNGGAAEHDNGEPHLETSSAQEEASTTAGPNSEIPIWKK